jgi:cytochrome c-type biogenesis protein CcmH
MSRRWSLCLALGALALAPLPALADAEPDGHGHAAQAGEDLQEYVEGASRLEGRIMAPCCWNQTIDIHGSEPAYELRREIRRRLKAGESPDAIEATLVKRHGERILAVPPGSPLAAMATMMGLVFAGAGVGGYFMLKRWQRQGQKPSAPKPEKGAKPLERDALDDRLDRELSEIRDQA